MMLVLLVVVVFLASVSWGYPYAGAVPRLDGRIVGGKPTTIEEFPYQVSLLYWKSHTCGGSLISEHWVVTAAHCTSGRTASSYSVRYGSSYRNSGGDVVSVSSINVHPQYNAWLIDYDISIIRLENVITLGNTAGLIGLPSQQRKFYGGEIATVTGWGTLREGGFLPSQLQRVEVPLVSSNDCVAAYAGHDVTERMLCAGYIDGGKDACQGDSGGPLVIEGELIGIVSWGYGCARPNYPGVYSNVPSLRSYITEICGL